MSLLRPDERAMGKTAYNLFEQGRQAERWSAEEIIGRDATNLSEDQLHLAWDLASHSYYAEQAGLIAAAELAAETEDFALRLSMATATSDEARHSDAFLTYAKARGGDLSECKENVEGLHETLGAVSYLEKILVHTMLESFAADEFIILSKVFEGDPLGEIYRHVRQDEVRHVAMGLDYLQRSTQDPRFRDHWMEGGPAWEQRCLELAGLPEVGRMLGELSGRPAEEIYDWFLRRHRARLRGAGVPFVEAERGGDPHDAEEG